MRSIYEHFILFIAVSFIAISALNGCAEWQPTDTQQELIEKTICVSLCTAELSIENTPETAKDGASIGIFCLKKCSDYPE